MNCVGFPKIFEGNSTIVKKDTFDSNEATLECLKLLLLSEANTLFGDPDFGVALKRYLFDLNNLVLHDILIDELYTKITVFCPLLYLTRSDIKLTADKSTVYVSITTMNQETFLPNLFNLALFELGDQ